MSRRSELAQYAKRNGITEPVSKLEVGPGGVIYVLDDDEAGYRHHRNWSRAVNSITLPRHNPAGGKPRPQRERGPA